MTATTHYGKAVATAWDRLHPLLVRRSAWGDHPEGDLPVIEGTVIRLQVDHLRGDRSPRPVWLWWSATAATAGMWAGSGRHSYADSTLSTPSGWLKQTLGWTAPRLREPTAGHGSSSQPTPSSALPAPRRRPPQSLGTARPPRAPHTRARPSRISPPPQENASAGQRTETHHRGPRRANRDEEQAPRARAPRRETEQTEPRGSHRKQQSCINAKGSHPDADEAVGAYLAQSSLPITAPRCAITPTPTAGSPSSNSPPMQQT